MAGPNKAAVRDGASCCGYLCFRGPSLLRGHDPGTAEPSVLPAGRSVTYEAAAPTTAPLLPRDERGLPRWRQSRRCCRRHRSHPERAAGSSLRGDGAQGGPPRTDRISPCRACSKREMICACRFYICGSKPGLAHSGCVELARPYASTVGWSARRTPKWSAPHRRWSQ